MLHFSWTNVQMLRKHGRALSDQCHSDVQPQTWRRLWTPYPLSPTPLILRLGPILWFYVPLTIQFSGCSLLFFPFYSFSSKFNSSLNYNMSSPHHSSFQPNLLRKIFFLLKRGENIPELQSHKRSINPRTCRDLFPFSALQRSWKELPWRKWKRLLIHSDESGSSPCLFYL